MRSGNSLNRDGICGNSGRWRYYGSQKRLWIPHGRAPEELLRSGYGICKVVDINFRRYLHPLEQPSEKLEGMWGRNGTIRQLVATMLGDLLCYLTF